jgi:hypothetical protein
MTGKDSTGDVDEGVMGEARRPVGRPLGILVQQGLTVVRQCRIIFR